MATAWAVNDRRLATVEAAVLGRLAPPPAPRTPAELAAALGLELSLIHISEPTRPY